MAVKIESGVIYTATKFNLKNDTLCYTKSLKSIFRSGNVIHEALYESTRMIYRFTQNTLEDIKPLLKDFL